MAEDNAVESEIKENEDEVEAVQNMENEADDEKEKEQPIRILIIDKGFGGSKQKLKHLRGRFKDDNVRVVAVTEPSDKQKYDESVEKSVAAILEWKPTVIIASSRGGYYAASLLNHKDETLKGYINGHCTFLLLSSMDSQKCCLSNHPILLYHARNDGINNVLKVKADCDSYPLSKLIVAEEDSHSLESLKGEDNTKICDIVIEAMEWFQFCQVDENRKKLLSKVDRKKQKKVKNRFNLLNQIQAKHTKEKQ